MMTEKALRKALAQGAELERNPASRFAFVAQEAGAVLLFVDGECYECSGVAAGFAQAICARERLVVDRVIAAGEEAKALIVELLNQGSLAFVEDD